MLTNFYAHAIIYSADLTYQTLSTKICFIILGICSIGSSLNNLNNDYNRFLSSTKGLLYLIINQQEAKAAF